MPLRPEPNVPLQPRLAIARRFDEAKAVAVLERLREALEAAADAGMPDAASQIEQALDVAQAELLRGGTQAE